MDESAAQRAEEFLIRQLERELQGARNSLDQHKRLLDLAQKERLRATEGGLAQWLSVLARRFPPGTWRGDCLNKALLAPLQLVRCMGRLFRKVRRSLDLDYSAWIRLREPGAEQLRQQRQAQLAWQPRISLIALADSQAGASTLLSSLFEQTYTNWELCLCVRKGQEASLQKSLHHRKDERICVISVSEFADSFAAMNLALAQAGGELVGLVDIHDALAPFSLYEIARAFSDPETDLVYSDEDRLGRWRRREPVFKPAWSPETLRSHNYIGRLVIYRRSLLEKVGGFRSGFAGAEEYDLLLRASEQSRHNTHLPKVLYHRGTMPSGSAAGAHLQDAVRAAEKKALQEHLCRLHIAGEVREGISGSWHIAYSMPVAPLISIIIPNRDNHELLVKCVQSIQRSTYRNYEIVVVENNSQESDTFACYHRLAKLPGFRLLTWDRPFNYSAVNNFAARQARGQMLLFLNNDVEAIGPDWLERLLEHAHRPQVGAVGAKLYYPDDTIQHAGVGVGLGGVAGHFFLNYPRSARDIGQRLTTVRNLSAVTAACLMTRKDVFTEAGGFDENFTILYNDVDLCLTMRARGYAVIWTPFAELYHFESRTRGTEDTLAKRVRRQNEIDLFRLKWQDFLRAGDPFYSPNLSLHDGDFSPRLHPNDAPRDVPEMPSNCADDLQKLRAA